MKTKQLISAVVLGLITHGAAGAASDAAQADVNRKKPLQRCDQMNGKAELECLKKARENIVEARKKRESTAEAKKASGKSAAEAKTDAGKTADASEKAKKSGGEATKK